MCLVFVINNIQVTGSDVGQPSVRERTESCADASLRPITENKSGYVSQAGEMGIFMVCTPHGMYGGEERCMWGFVGEMSEKGTIWKM